MKNDNTISTTIFYFSSTGNSLAAARRFKDKLGNAEIISIPGIIDSAADASAGRIIIIFPVYMWGLPNIVRIFLEKLKVPENAELYTVITYAGLAGDPHKAAIKILKKKGINISSGFLLWMPENFTPRYGTWPKWLEKFVLKLSLKKIERIIGKIKGKKKGIRQRSRWGINRLLTFIHNFLAKKLFEERTLKPADYFRVLENCSGCGICMKVCPAGNIEMKKGKPLWGGHCELCTACFQWCPQKAVEISYFRDTKRLKGRYHHPDVTVNDFIMR